MSTTTVIRWVVNLNGFSLPHPKNLSLRYLFGFLVRKRERWSRVQSAKSRRKPMVDEKVSVRGLESYEFKGTSMLIYVEIVVPYQYVCIYRLDF